jgi:4-oxalomesaconate hydratase
MSGRRLLVIGAHSADFVWRAGGAIAVCTAGGGEAQVVALSYGERGESGELWKEDGQTVDKVKRVRHGEAERADHRGNHARRASGDQSIRQAEAFQRVIPQVVSAL